MWSPAEHSASTVEAIAPMPDAERQGVLGALELGDGLLERPHRRVGVAAVEVAGPHPGGPLAGVVEALGLPRARAPQRGVEAGALVAPPGGDRPGGGGGRSGWSVTGRRSRGGQASWRPAGPARSAPVASDPTGSPNVRAPWTSRGASAIVTGGASGIGAASARLLAERGRQGRRRRPPGGQGQGAGRRDRRRLRQGRRHQHRRHRQRRRDGQVDGPGARARQLGRHRLGPAHGRQGRLVRVGGQPRRASRRSSPST